MIEAVRAGESVGRRHARLPVPDRVTTVRQILNFVDGSERAASAGETFETIDPYRRQPWAQVALSAAADVEEAVASARHAFDRGRGRACR